MIHDLTQEQLTRNDVAVGTARELPLDRRYVWNQFAPFRSVASDDVIIQYAKPQAELMTPARAEDAQSELSRKDDYMGTATASIMDWAEKHRYQTSKVTRYRRFIQAGELLDNAGIGSDVIGIDVRSFEEEVARDAVERRRRLERRMEWLVMNQALSTGEVNYNDGKIVFSVAYGRPADQQAAAPPSGVLWNVGDGTHDPVGDLIALDEFMEDRYDVTMKTVIMGRKAIRFAAESNLVKWMASNRNLTVAEAANLLNDREGSRAFLEARTGLNIIEYDAKWATRALGTTNHVVNRFLPENRMIMLPDLGDASELIATDLGFGKMLTSPHAAGGFASGFYSWEEPPKQDPWQIVQGTGIKAFPIFPAMNLTLTADLW